MIKKYNNKFPVAFSTKGRKQHLYLTSKDFEKITNNAKQQEIEAEKQRLDTLVEDLRKIRLAQKTTGGEIRVYARSLNSSKALLKTIHPKIRKDNFVEIIGISDAKQNWKNYPWPRIHISKNGIMSPDDRKLMYSDLDEKVLIIMSGGEGRSNHLFYRPIAQFMRTILEKEMYLWAVCMSYQVLADQLLCLGIKRGQNVPPPQQGRFHIGTQIAEVTEYGMKDPVFSQIGPSFGIEAANHYRIYGADLKSDKPQKKVKVMARDKTTNEIIALKYGETCWAIQYHPEIKKMARAGKGFQKKHSLATKDNAIIIPPGIHSHQQLVLRVALKKKDFFEKYNITVDDLQHFFHPSRCINNIGDTLTLNILEQAVASKKRQLNIN